MLSTGEEIFQPVLLELKQKNFKLHMYPMCVDVKLLVGFAVVQMLNPGAVTTCQEYADILSVPYVLQQLPSAMRVDVA